MQSMIHPVLLCGGSGTRLWPLSRKSHPKQFAKLLADGSLFQSSALRLSGDYFAQPTVVTGSDFRFTVLEQLSALEISPLEILIEPAPRNTAAAVCAAVLAQDAKSPDSYMLIAPSDHVIPDAENFRASVLAAVDTAQQGQIVTFGIRPDRPETGYGWLELTSKFSKGHSLTTQPIVSFVEKPTLEHAKVLFEGEMHLWNSGIFLFKTSTIINAFAQYAPNTLKHVKNSFENAKTDLGFTRFAYEPWSRLEDISIDYAIMERAPNVSVMPYDGTWSDLGDWNAIKEIGKPDVNGNVTNGPATTMGCHDTLIHATSETQQIIAIGVKDIVAVAMPDAVLVTHKKNVQDVKGAVKILKSKGVTQAEFHARDYRPWGWYESIAIGDSFQVKRIVVNSGASLSLQSHKHRAEHWIVVEGTAQVTIADRQETVSENQSVYIPLGAIHRLENPGKNTLTLIEVQTGSYLGEDDIIRYEDIYHRGQGAKG